MLYRLGANAKMGKDSFTKYTLASALQVRPEKVEEWIARGWLERRDIAVGAGKRTVIDADAFCDFCKKHAKDVVGNRLSKERLEFVYHFVFPRATRNSCRCGKVRKSGRHMKRNGKSLIGKQLVLVRSHRRVRTMSLQIWTLLRDPRLQRS
jgi:hypothetical protein